MNKMAGLNCCCVLIRYAKTGLLAKLMKWNEVLKCGRGPGRVDLVCLPWSLVSEMGSLKSSLTLLTKCIITENRHREALAIFKQHCAI